MTIAAAPDGSIEVYLECVSVKSLCNHFVLHVELRAATHVALRVGVSKFGRAGQRLSLLP